MVRFDDMGRDFGLSGDDLFYIVLAKRVWFARAVGVDDDSVSIKAFHQACQDICSSAQPSIQRV